MQAVIPGSANASDSTAKMFDERFAMPCIANGGWRHGTGDRYAMSE